MVFRWTIWVWHSSLHSLFRWVKLIQPFIFCCCCCNFSFFVICFFTFFTLEHLLHTNLYCALRFHTSFVDLNQISRSLQHRTHFSEKLFSLTIFLSVVLCSSNYIRLLQRNKESCENEWKSQNNAVTYCIHHLVKQNPMGLIILKGGKYTRPRLPFFNPGLFQEYTIAFSCW